MPGKITQEVKEQAKIGGTRACSKGFKYVLGDNMSMAAGAAALTTRAGYDLQQGRKTKTEVASDVAATGICQAIPQGKVLLKLAKAYMSDISLDDKNKVRMAVMCELIGGMLGAAVFGSIGSVFPFVGTSIGSFMGKELGELGGRIFVDTQAIMGPVDFYNKTIVRLFAQQVEDTPSGIPDPSSWSILPPTIA